MPENTGETPEELVASWFSGDVVRLRKPVDGRHVCPVCGMKWEAGAEPAWVKTSESTAEGLPMVEPNWGICPCCDTEFGNDDVNGPAESLGSSWARLRAEWLARDGATDAALKQLRENLGLDV